MKLSSLGLLGCVFLFGATVAVGQTDSDASAFKSEVESDGGTLANLPFTSNLITALKAISISSGGNAYTALYAGYYPGAYQKWGSDANKLDVVYDLSRHGRAFYSNNSDSKRPYLVTGQIASQPVTRHDANKGWMRTFWTPPAQPHNLFVLFKPTGTSATSFVSSSTEWMKADSSSTVWVDGNGWASVSAAQNAWSTLAVRCEAALGSQGWKVWGNGSAVRNDTPYGSAGSDDLRVGGVFDQGAPVDIGLVLYYAVSLTDAEIVAIDSAIQSAYLGSSDTTAPSVPTGLAPSSITTTSFTLSWAASSDNVGVTGYEVFRDGTSIGTPSGTSLSVTGLSPNTTYAMTVSARDAAGNWSAQSTALNVTTANGADTTAPSVPTGLSPSSITTTSFTLGWAASSDNIGVTGYEVFRDGTSIGTPTGTSLSVTGLSPNTTYAMTVRARDAAGNWSAQSTALNVTTAGGGQTDSDASAFKSEVESDGGTLANLPFTSNLITALKAISISSGGNAYTALYAGYYPGAYQKWGSDPNKLDVVYDLSRNGRAFFSNNSDSKRPYLVTGQVASQPVTRHDANKGWMRTFWTPPAQPHNLFVLFKPTGTSTTSFVSSSTEWMKADSSSTVWVDGNGWASVSAAQNAWSTVAVRCEAALGSQGWKVWGNGSAVRNDTPYSSSAGSDDLRVGGVFDQGAPVDIGLVLYYAVSLTDSEIVAIDSAIQSAYLGSSDTTAPSVPTGLSPSSITTTSFTLSWAAASDNVGVTGYEVFRDGNSIGTPTGTSLSVTGLSPNTTYAMTVRARDAAGNWSSQSTALNVTTATGADTTAPSVPTGLTPSSIVTTSVTLSWTTSTDNVGVTGYEVFRNGTSIGTPSGTSLSVTGLSPNTTYTMTVRARDAAGNWSAQSAALNVTTASDTTAPSVPTGLAPSSITTTSFTLSWAASSDNIGVTGYEVFRGGTSIGTPAGTSVNVTGLSPATTYQMTVRARDAAGNWSAQSNALAVTTANNSGSTPHGGSAWTVGATIQAEDYDDGGEGVAYHDTTSTNVGGGYRSEGVDMEACGEGGYNVGWTVNGEWLNYTVNVAAAGDYNIQLRVAAMDAQTIAISSDGTALGSVNIPATGGWQAYQTVTLPNVHLIAGTQVLRLSFTSSTSNGGPNLNWLQLVSAADATAPSVPSGLVSSNITTTSFTLSWSASTDNIGVTGYEILRNGTSIGTSTTTSVSVTGLSPATDYQMTVRARDAAGNWSAQSGALTVTTGIPPSGLVLAMNFDEGTGTTANDLSGHNNHGTMVNDSFVSGHTGTALNSASGGRVEIPTPASDLRFTSDMTVEAWIRPTATNGGWQTVMGRQFGTSWDDSWWLGHLGTTLYFGAGATLTAPSPLVLNDWVHVAGVKAGSTVQLYVNGALVASTNTATSPLPNDAAAVGIGAGNNGNPLWSEEFIGQIDDVRAYAIALTQAEIQADMNTPVSSGGNTAPTISDIADQTIAQNGATAALAFTVSDAETAVGSLTVSGTSSDTTLVPNANIVFGGSGANRTVTVTPASGQSGTATITMTVSDGSLTASDTFVLTVANAQSPTISNITDRTINEDGATGAVAFTVSDPDTPVANLSVSGSSSNTAIVPINNIVFGGSGANRTVIVTPAANQNGSATITVTVSDGGRTAADSFVLSVASVNDVPTISSISNQTINEDANSGPHSFTIGDVETAPASLILSGDSSNTSLVPVGNIVFGGSGTGRTVTVTPAANQNGSATITVGVYDGTDTTTTSFTVNVTPVNDTPTISDIPNQTINEDGITAPLGFTIGDVETAATSLNITGASSNQTLVPNGNIAFSGSGANRTVTVTPAPNQNGSATITVTVNDGNASASDTFVLTVNGGNDAPTITPIGNQTINEDGSTGPLGFSIGDVETPAGSLSVTYSSSNVSLVPNGNIALGGSGASRTISVTPALNQFGTTTITINVSDGSATTPTSFNVVVNPVNDIPTISDIGDQTIFQGGSTSALGFTIGDVETAAGGLNVSATSSNTTLVPNANVVLGGSGANRNVTVTPVGTQTGSSIITVTVSDGSASASDTFVLTVNPGSTADLDGDGMPNDWETAHGLNPNYAADALEDPDGDGFTNVAEYNLNQDPRGYNAGSASTGGNEPSNWPTAGSSGYEVGMTAGELSVDKSGAATYTVSIWKTSGTAGMEPSVSLNYNSKAGPGIAGYGWSLSGTSAISRGPQTLAVDNNIHGVDFTYADRFYLDGQRLINVSGNYGENGTEYRTDSDTFSRIVSYGGAGNGPLYFKVWTKAGGTMEFGVTTDSRLIASGRDEVHTWALNKVSDVNGNYMTYSYYTDTPTGEQQLLRIDYSGHDGTPATAAYASIRFEYESRNDTSFGYVHGSMISSSQRLKYIKSFYGETTMRTYTLNYIERPVTGRSLLDNLIETGTEGKSYPPLRFEYSNPSAGWEILDASTWSPPLSAYGDTAGFIDINGDGRPDQIDLTTVGDGATDVWLNVPSGWIHADGQAGRPDYRIQGSGARGFVSDINGDGLVDVLLASGEAFINTGSGFAQSAAWTLPSMPPGQGSPPDALEFEYTRTSIRFIDANGDKRPDLVITGDAAALMPGDPDSPDNTSDYWDHIKVVERWTNLGGSSGPEITTSWQYYTAIDAITPALTQESGRIFDVDGDGRVEGVVRGLFYDTVPGQSNGTWHSYGTQPPEPLEITEDTLKVFPTELVDINGDGLVDTVRFNTGFGGDMTPPFAGNSASFNTGAGWVAAPSSFYSPYPLYSYLGDGLGVAFLDLDADGIIDVSRAVDGVRQTHLGTSSGWDALGSPEYGLPYQLVNTSFANHYTRASCDMIDLNGDGGIDEVWNGGAAVNRRSNPDRLVKVTNGFGAVASLTYAPLTERAADGSFTVYSKDFTAANPNDPDPKANVIGPIYVVKAVDQDDGLGGQYRLGYHYANMRSDRVHGNLGFEFMSVTDTRTNIVSTTQFSQTFPFIGMPISTSTITAGGGGIAISQSSTIYDVKWLNWITGGATRFAFPKVSTSISRDLDGSVVTQSTVTTQRGAIGQTDDYDVFGNALYSEVNTGDGFVKKTFSTYSNTVGSSTWLLGRLTNVTVTKEGPGQGSGTTRSSSFSYDGLGRLESETVEPGSSDNAIWLKTTYGYDSFGNKTSTSIQDRTGATRTSSATYDPIGRFRLSMTNAASQTVSFLMIPHWGVVQNATDINNLTSGYLYDGFGRLRQESRPDGTQLFTRRYWAGTSAPVGALYYIETEATAAAPSIEFFDKLGRTIQKLSINGDGRAVAVDTSYDTLGRAWRVSVPHYLEETAPGWTQTTAFDLLNRPLTMQTPDEEISGGYANTIFSYSGRTTRVTNPKGAVVRTTTNSQGWVTEVVQNENAVGSPAITELTKTYDVLGQLVETNSDAVDPAGVIITTVYDLRGRRTGISDPDTGIWTYSYNAFGELTSQIDAKGQETQMFYDALGRLVMRKVFFANHELSELTTWTFDSAPGAGKGKLHVAETFNAANVSQYRETYAYDTLGRTATCTRRIDGTDYVTSLEYDSVGRVARTIYPSTGAETFATRNFYNNYSVLKEVRRGDGAHNDVLWMAVAGGFNAAGAVEKFVLGNGVSTDRIVSPVTRRLRGINTGVNGGAGIQAVNYDYDAAANVELRSDAATSTNEGFAYDGLNRLTSQMINGVEQAVTYDRRGNITSKTGVGNYTYGSGAGPHAVTSISGGVLHAAASFAYDGNGNMISGADRAISWTPFDQVSRIDMPGGRFSEFAFGAGHERVKQTSNNGTTIYVGTLFEKFTPAGPNPRVENWHWIFTPSGRVASYKTFSAGAPETRYFHQDQLGSITAVTDHKGAVVYRMRYDAWGRRVDPNNGLPIGWLVAQPATRGRGFSDHEHLDDLGLIHMNGRVYDPILGRFLSADPYIQSAYDSQSHNRYSYCLNNPTNLTDPSGYFWEKIGSFFSGIFNAIGDAIGAIGNFVGNTIQGGVEFAEKTFTFSSAFAGSLINGGSIAEAFRSGAEGVRVRYGLTDQEKENLKKHAEVIIEKPIILGEAEDPGPEIPWEDTEEGRAFILQQAHMASLQYVLDHVHDREDPDANVPPLFRAIIENFRRNSALYNNWADVGVAAPYVAVALPVAVAGGTIAAPLVIEGFGVAGGQARMLYQAGQIAVRTVGADLGAMYTAAGTYAYGKTMMVLTPGLAAAGANLINNAAANPGLPRTMFVANRAAHIGWDWASRRSAGE